MIQQITNTRANKQLTANDLKHIAYASCLNLFHANTMFKPCPFGIRPGARIYYVKRVSENKYEYQFVNAHTEITLKNKPFSTDGYRSIETKTPSQLQELHPDLVCNKDGEERILIVYFYYPSNFDKFKLGFFLLSPKLTELLNMSFDNKIVGNFVSSLVITPKTGLFPVKKKE